MSAQLFDTERVEVLKGPQGTLYGRNATAGAVNIITRKPCDDFGARLTLGAGNFESFELEGSVGGRLGDSMAGRFAAFTRQRREGHTLNRVTGQEHGEEDVSAWRGMIDWSPQDNLSLLLRIDGGRDRSDQWYFQHLGFLDPATFGLCQAFLEGRIDESSCVDLAGYSDPDSDPFAGDYSLEPVLDDSSAGASLTIDRVGDAFSLHSITGYWRFDQYAEDEGDSSPAVGNDNVYRSDIKQFSQELRLVSSRPVPIGSNGPSLDWIVGAYYSVDEVAGDPATVIFLDDYLLTRGAVAYDQDTEAVAVFGHTIWRWDRWNLVAGLRQTWEDKRFVGTTTDLNPWGTSCLLGCDPGFVGPFVFASADNSLSTSDLSGKLGLEYSPRDNWLI